MMADFADMGADREQQDLALALAHRKPAGPAPTGYCLICGEPVGHGRRWCGAECRDGWQAAERAKNVARG